MTEVIFSSVRYANGNFGSDAVAATLGGKLPLVPGGRPFVVEAQSAAFKPLYLHDLAV